MSEENAESADQASAAPNSEAGSGGEAARAPWIGNRSLITAWLMVFFPVGLWGLWRGGLFDTSWKVGLSVAVVALFVVLGMNFAHPLYVLILFPVALVILWRSENVRRAITYRFAAAWGALLLLFFANAALAPSGFDGAEGDGGSCAAVLTEGSCSYYRDSDCNVIARQCG